MDIIKSLRMNLMGGTIPLKKGFLHLAANLSQRARVLGMIGTRRMTGRQAHSRGDHPQPTTMMAGLVGMTPKILTGLKTSQGALLMGLAQALVALGSRMPCGARVVFSEVCLNRGTSVLSFALFCGAEERLEPKVLGALVLVRSRCSICLGLGVYLYKEDRKNCLKDGKRIFGTVTKSAHAILLSL
uniref:Uncharacterized protein n=1 Tax=Opuntia streptacantha TaxID=393608 RepID=A0A7C9B1G2_OPUST